MKLTQFPFFKDPQPPSTKKLLRLRDSINPNLTHFCIYILVRKQKIRRQDGSKALKAALRLNFFTMSLSPTASCLKATIRLFRILPTPNF